MNRAKIFLSIAFGFFSLSSIQSAVVLPPHADAVQIKLLEFALSSNFGVFPDVDASANLSKEVRKLTWEEIGILKKSFCKYHERHLGALINLLPQFESERAHKNFIEATNSYLENLERYIIIQDPVAGLLIFTEKADEFLCYEYTARYGVSIIPNTLHYHRFGNFVYTVLQERQSKQRGH